MNDSQRVVDKAHVVGGWIPVPQEMFAATGVDEATVLGTKQWGRVVPMMRKIGDYVLEKYLANDPRKTMIFNWKTRYCVAPNQKKKEAMISPVVGFIYILDSFKNHRGPSELGRARNTWRKRLLAQINCKAVWKRTHTALAKIIHNPVNMADSNPGKKLTKIMRRVYRDPNVPWSMADYGNLGYPGEDEDEDAPLSVESALTAPTAQSAPPPSPMLSQNTGQDRQGEAQLDLIEASDKPATNRDDNEMVDENSSDDAPPSPPPQPGKVPIPQAATAQQAEANFNKPGTSGDDSDNDDDDDMGAVSEEINQEGFPENDAVPKKVEPQPAEVPVAPPAPPPPPGAPGEGVETTVPAASEPPPPSPEAEEAPLPVQQGNSDPVDVEILQQNGQNKPPPPPDGDKISAIEAEYQSKIKELQAQIAELKKSDELLTAQKATEIAEKTKELEELERKSEELNAKYAAHVKQYETEREKWEQERDRLDQFRKNLEQRLTELSEKYDETLRAHETKVSEMAKLIEQLKEARESTQHNLEEAQKLIERYEKQIDDLQRENTRIALAAQKLDEADENYAQKLDELKQEAEAQDERARKQQEQLEQARNEIKTLTKERADIDDQLKEVQANLQKLEDEKNTQIEEYKKQIFGLRAEVAASSEAAQQLAEVRLKLETQTIKNKELDDKVKSLEALTTAQEEQIASLTQQIAELQAKITELETQNAALQTKLQTASLKITNLNARIEELQKLSSEPDPVLTNLRRNLFEADNTIGQQQKTIEKLQNALLSVTQNVQNQITATTTKAAEEVDKLRAQWAITDANYKQQIEELNTAKTDAETERMKLENEIRELKATKEALSTQIEGNNNEINTLQTSLTEQRSDNERLRNLLETANAKVQTTDQLEEQLAALQEQVEHFKGMETSLQEKEQVIKTLQAQLDRLTDTNKDFATTLQNWPATVESYNNMIRELQEQVEQQRAQMAESSTKLDTVTQEKTQLTSANMALQEEINRLKTENDGYAQRMAGLNASIRDLQAKLKEATDNETNAIRAKTDLERNYQAAESACSEQLINIKKENGEKIAQLQQQLEQQKQQMAALDAEKLQLQQELAAKIAQIEAGKKELERIPALEQLVAQLQETVDELNETLELFQHAPEPKRARLIPEEDSGNANTLMQDIPAENPPVQETVATEKTPTNVTYQTTKATKIKIDNRETTLVPILIEEASGKKQKVWLVVEWKAAGIPGNMYYVNRRFEPLKRDHPNLANLARLKAWLFEKGLDAQVPKADLTDKKQIDNALNIGSGEERQLAAENVQNDEIPEEQQTTVVYDPAQVLDLFKQISNENRIHNYQQVIKQILGKIQAWIADQGMTEQEQVQFLTDPRFVDKDRQDAIQEMGKTSNAIWTALLSAIDNLNPRDQKFNTFKKWLKNWNLVPFIPMENAAEKIMFLDPLIIYHTIAGAVRQTIAPGPQHMFRGFGYNPAVTIGRVPIPVGTKNAQNLYDYYGYGFNPFSKTLNNPPSYYTDDYYGYRPF